MKRKSPKSAAKRMAEYRARKLAGTCIVKLEINSNDIVALGASAAGMPLGTDKQIVAAIRRAMYNGPGAMTSGDRENYRSQIDNLIDRLNDVEDERDGLLSIALRLDRLLER